MTELVHFQVSAQSSSGLLCKIVGLFAQLGLPAPVLHVSVAGASMRVQASLANFGDVLVQTVARKISGFVGVDWVKVV